MADIFTSVGEQLAADYFDGSASAPANWYGAWGTGAGTAAKGDTTLFTEAAEARVSATESQPAANQNRLVWTQTSASAQTITNAGIFSAAAAGSMPLKTNFTGIALAISDQIQFTFTLTWG